MKWQALLAAWLLSLPGITAAATDPTGHFRATAEVQTKTGNRRMAFEITISNPMTRSEAAPLKEVLRSSGQTGVANAVRGAARGTLNLGGLLYSLDVVSVDPLEHGYHYIVVTTRPLRIEEVNEGSPSVQYPFAVLIFDVPEFAKGTGTLYQRASLRIDENDQVQIDQWEATPGKLEDIERIK
jgi:hypothetical protein